MRTVCRVVCGFVLAGATWLDAQPAAPLQVDFADAILRDWVQPEYPETARQAKLEGKVDVEFVVEPDGRVSRATVKDSTDERFNASALAAVARWVFGPALAEGKPVASGMKVPVVFKLEQLRQKKVPLQPLLEWMPEALPVKPPKLALSPDPDYPAELMDRRLPGQVALEFTVEAEGVASAPKVLWAPHAAFVAAALQTLAKYRFEPAHQGLVPLKSGPTQAQMEFQSLGADRTELLAANQITVVESEKFAIPPRPSVLPEPVYPLGRLLAGTPGTATVGFTVTGMGKTTAILVQEASQPEFGAALVAAVEAWGFEPALIADQPTEAALVVKYRFTPQAGGEVNRLLLALRPDGVGVNGPGGLDQRLRPLWRVAPVYPQSLVVERPAGQAVIEFVVDREGRARLPRVKSASRDEFGWAAAMAVSQWVFAPPRRGGEPVDVKVGIPFEFTAPRN
jgi:TonB family protein